MLDPDEPITSRLLLSEPAESAKLAATDAEYSIDRAISQLNLDAVSVIRALLTPNQNSPVSGESPAAGDEQPQAEMLHRVGQHVDRALMNISDALNAVRTLAKKQQLVAADNAEIRLASSHLISAQMTLSEVVSLLRSVDAVGGAKVPGSGERLIASLTRARNFTCAAYERLDDVPAVCRQPLRH